MLLRSFLILVTLSLCLNCKAEQSKGIPGSSDNNAEAQRPQSPQGSNDENLETPNFGSESSEEELGQQCISNEECPSKHCTETPDGAFCAEPCQTKDDCPTGFVCKSTPTSGGTQLLCVHPFPEGCKPCKTNDDCAVSDDFTVDCHEFSGNSVCMARCSENEECPVGFTCIPSSPAEPPSLCVPVVGSCACKAKYLGAEGSCMRTSVHGVCEGTYTCPAPNSVDCSAEVPIAELCNQKDDDCDGEIDEGGSGETKCNVCDGACTTEKKAPFELSPETSNGVSLDEDGNIVLGVAEYESHFLWIANSAENTLSKLDTITGMELGRYKICGDPSRTAVDLEGDCWVACRAEGKVSKVRNLIETCPDKNGNGIIDTSKDSDGDGIIQPGEMLPMGQDECVLFTVEFEEDDLVRAAGVDADNYAWVGLWHAQQLRKLNPLTGATEKILQLPAQPYGLVIDQNGIIWVAGRGGMKLVRVDPSSGAIEYHQPPGSCVEPYGITIDPDGHIWIGNNGCGGSVVYRYIPDTGEWSSVATDVSPRGIAASLDGFVYVANDSSNRVTKINRDTMSIESYLDLGAGRFPVGVAIDSDGFVWAVNQASSTVVKAAPQTMTSVLEVPVGTGPYTYSDMTGYSLMNFTAPTGSFRMTFESTMRQPVNWNKAKIDFEAPGDGDTWVTIKLRAANQLPELANATWVGPFGPYPPQTFPANLSFAALYGVYAQIEVTLHSKASGLTPKVKAVALESKL